MSVGYEVETAKNGREALEKIAACSYDLILSDVRMPELDGVGLYRELERHAPRLLQRLILLSGTTDSAEYIRFLEGTGALVLCKPFDIDTLQRLFHELLLDQETLRPANGDSPSSSLGHADQSMLNTAVEQKRQSVGMNPPHQRPDAERRPLGGNYLQLYRGSRLQLGLGSDFRTTRADIHGARQVSARPDVDNDGPGHAGTRVVPPVLLMWKRHDGRSLQLMSTRNLPAHCLPCHGVQPRAPNEQHGSATSEEPERGGEGDTSAA